MTDATRATEAKPNILAIDDTPENLLTLRAALGAEFRLQFATSGATGLALAEAAPPDLVLLDVMMPEMDGYEVCRRLKADPRLRTIPVIFVTGLIDSDAESAGLALGAAGYITKPINVEIARQRIRNLLERELLRTEVEDHRDHLDQMVQARTVALSIAREAAEAANRAKTAFLRNVSHELRTPMTAIMGMTELALRRATDPKLSAQLGTVKQSSAQLLALINDVIDITELEANQLGLERSRFKLASVLDALTGLFSQEAGKKGLALNIETGPALAELSLLGDPLRLGQILQNLTANAIKFTSQGSVSLAASLSEEGRDDVLVRFEVRDTGIGIDPKDQKRIFNLFEQADDSPTRRYSGTGLGLALSKRLIEFMGGEIDLQSQPGSGSVFRFTVRLGKAGDDLP
ncbi:MAG: ATP-binding protein [Proteobacteria bacterium]|nr:ATP-binding protein [Pseudomonadota bacterium]